MSILKTIKLTKDYWKKIVPGLRFGVPDPLNVFSEDPKLFSGGLTSFNFHGVYKTTKANRHANTQARLKSSLDEMFDPPIILDIGASDGSTSLDLLNSLDRFKKYYVTDYNIKCTYIKYKNHTFFFERRNECILVASNKFVFYPENKTIFHFLFKKQLDKIKGLPKKELLLINRDLLVKQAQDKRIDIREYNIFEPWQGDKVNIVIVANLLNDAYFSKDRISAALQNCFDALSAKGLLVIIRNSLTHAGNETERSSLFRKDSNAGKFIKTDDVGGGAEIENFVVSLNF